MKVISFLSILGFLPASVSANGLVGPGGVVPFGGGGGGGRRASYGVVRDAAKGFFVTGSSIKGVNGVFERTEGLPRGTKLSGIYYKDGSLTYRNAESGWFLAMVDTGHIKVPKDEKLETERDWDWQDMFGGGGDDEDDGEVNEEGRKVAKRTHWVLIDENHKPRFAHEGDTILPGAGTSWWHLLPNLYGLGAKKKPRNQVLNQEQNGVEIDELPWQVVAVMDPDMIYRLKYHHRHHNEVIRQAIAGDHLPELTYDGPIRTSFTDQTEPPSSVSYIMDTVAGTSNMKRTDEQKKDEEADVF